MSGIEVAASIIGVAAFGIALAEKLTDFYGSFEDAPEDVEFIALELSTLTTLMSTLGGRIKNEKPFLSNDGIREAGVVSKRIKMLFDKILKLLPEASSDDGMKSFQRVKWHFKQKRCSMILTRLAACRIDILVLFQLCPRQQAVEGSSNKGDEVGEAQQQRDTQVSILLGSWARTTARLKVLEKEAKDEETTFLHNQPNEPPKDFVSVEELMEDDKAESKDAKAEPTVFQKLHSGNKIQGPRPCFGREEAREMVRTLTITQPRTPKESEPGPSPSSEQRNSKTPAKPSMTSHQTGTEDKPEVPPQQPGREAEEQRFHRRSRSGPSTRQPFPMPSPQIHAGSSRDTSNHNCHIGIANNPPYGRHQGNAATYDAHRHVPTSSQAPFAYIREDSNFRIRAAQRRLALLSTMTETIVTFWAWDGTPLVGPATTTETTTFTEDGLSKELLDDHSTEQYQMHWGPFVAALRHSG
ncbi:hypothetical protein H2200_007709 [Cladophialophora chaetospira]|uniref:Fungal N-terminal domain-containing protein n=1 Tax=Cladophialophora chaetospira TaxID=386627 RepID=A0AA39CGC3_9EURO|nr:hypothetical protein H2200_007709 [Cladophialophora chaetospira]